MSDFMPKNWTAFAEWAQNFATQFSGIASKSGAVQAIELSCGKDWGMSRFRGCRLGRAAPRLRWMHRTCPVRHRSRSGHVAE